jgi:hypothetical protein
VSCENNIVVPGIGARISVRLSLDLAAVLSGTCSPGCCSPEPLSSQTSMGVPVKIKP